MNIAFLMLLSAYVFSHLLLSRTLVDLLHPSLLSFFSSLANAFLMLFMWTYFSNAKDSIRCHDHH
jgi:hypothetical protein